MMVINAITLTVFIVTGITLVTCAVSIDKRRPESRKTETGKGVGHKRHDDNTSDGLALALSDFEVVRRSLGPVPAQKYMNKPNSPLTEGGKNRKIIEKLKLSVTLRENIRYIFSYLLYGHENGLTEEQYASLHMLYDILRKRMVHVYNMLHILPKLENKDKNQQTKIVLSSMIENLPPYLSCTAKFLIGEIQLKKINLNVLLRPTKSERFNYLANISRDSIVQSKTKDTEEELREHDKYSNITQKALGPMFAKLLHILHTSTGSLSQELFGLILMNLPTSNDDPVLEENIRYLYEVTGNNLIINWDFIGNDPVGKDAYTLVFSVLSKILNNPSTDTAVKNAAVYVYNHLKITPSIYDNPNFKYTYNLIKQDLDLGLLLSAIVPQEFDEDAIRMKDHLLRYFMQNYRNKDLDEAVKGFNRFGYDNPLDLLMAFLTRILNRIPASKIEILQPAAALLSAVIMKKHVRTFTPFVSPEVDILILLESLRNPDLNPMLPKLVDSIKLELTSHPRMSVLLSTLIPTEKDKCLTARQCLINTFQQIQRLHAHLPITLATKIQNVLYILQTTVQTHTFSMQYSMVPQNVDFYNMGPKNPTMMNDVNSMITKLDVSYAWNVNKYIGEMGPHTQEKSTERERENPTITASVETKEPAILSPLLHSTSPQTFYSTTRHTTTMESIPEEFNFETEYSHAPEMIESSRKSSYNILPPIPKHALKPGKLYEHVTHIAPYSSMSPESSEEISENTAPKLSLEETSVSGNISAAIVLPPLIKPNRPLAVQLSNNGVPVVTTDERHDGTEPEIVLPEIQLLLKSPDVDNFFEKVDTPIATRVLRPLSAIFGKNYISKILKDVNPRLYPTNIALLTALFKRAKNHPQVAKMPELMSSIREYIAGMEYVCPTILLPIVISLKRLTSDVVYSTFNPYDLTHSEISENPPDDSSSDTVTIPLVNPTTWLQPINPSDPYTDLLPTLPKDDAFGKKLRVLKRILTHEKITEILGPDFKPLLYPNKGALFTTLLHKLQKVKAIQSNASLKSIIDLYIHAVQISSMNTKVSESNLLKMMSESTGHWQPELTSLTYALPVPKSDAEIAMIKTMQDFLVNPDLLEKLRMAKPPMTMSRGEFLRKIIQKVLSSNMHLEKRILKALKYYKDKVMISDMGALPIIWMWVQVYVVKAEVKLGDMIQKTLDFDRLPYQEKLAYNNLVTYLAENPHFLQNNEDFAFEKYKTQGEFVKAFLKYLLKKAQVSDHIKKNIRMLLPRVVLTGPGAVPLPSFSESF
ncbi:uncharacterized protein LOC105182425 [Harpegnathos saltator]|uniref:uncharacterized protein LOC105182425 n=1 Tax=Harpegnathos saltator TaxID=610380 RepID=UPI000DBED9C7|nr:uncharacterized protein LOC105182425 [Harpegnathos saltator]